MKARDINATIRYTMWSVFRRTGRIDDTPGLTATSALRSIEGATADSDLVIRAGMTSPVSARTPT